MPRTPAAWTLAAGAAALFGLARPAAADLAVIALDNHSINVNGTLTAAQNPPPDAVAIVDVAHYPPRLVATVEAPTSVVGAPTSLWIAPDESWLIVTSASKLDPQNPGKTVENDQVSVIDLKASPPRVVQSVTAGKGANEVSVSPEGNIALVANRAEGTVSVFAVNDKRLTAAGKVGVGDAKSLPSSVKFLPDSETALVTRYGDNSVAVLKVEAAKVTVTPHKIVTGVNPYTMDINRDGTLAVVGNMGGGATGDIGTVSLIDLTRDPPGTVDTVAVPASPEGVKFSPDGRFVAVASVEGSTRPHDSPLFHDHGRLWLLAVADNRLKPLAEAPIGRWSQGIVFSRDGRTILVESMIEHGLDVFRWQGGRLVRGATLDLKGGAAAGRTPWP
jgi:DNA-binding beta-propeller fold protein YncE